MAMDRDSAAVRLRSDGDLFDRMKKWFHEDRDHCESWHRAAREEFDFVAGHQWKTDDKIELERQGRTPLVMNRAATIIDSVVGSEVANRQEVRFLPRTDDDAPQNELLTEAGRWFRDECDADHEESGAFSDMVQVGMGWTETRIDYESNPDGDPKVENTSPLEMFWDNASRKANLTDARRFWRVRCEVPLDEALGMFPDAEPEAIHAAWAKEAGEDEGELSLDERPRYRDTDHDGGDHDGPPSMVTIVQVQWFEREPFYRGVLTDPASGQSKTVELSPEEHATAEDAAKANGAKYRGFKQYRKVWYQAFLGADWLQKPEPMMDPQGRPAPGASFHCVTGKLDKTRGHFYGLVRAMRDPQQYANKWLSQAMHILNASAKGGWFAEYGAFEDPAQAQRDIARPDAITFVKNGALSGEKIKEKPQAQFPAAFMQMTEFAVSAIRDTTGVNAEVLGMREADQAASLEAQRTKAATTILQPLFDSLRRYRKLQGRYMLYLITGFLSDGRLVRIAGDDAAQYVPLIRQEDTIAYDVIVDEAPTSANNKEMIWAMLMQFLPAIKDSIPPQVMLTLLQYSPLPASAVAKITQAAKEAAQDPAAQQQQQIQIQTLQAQLQLLQSQAAEKQASAMHKGVLAHREATGANDVGEADPNGIEIMQGLADVEKTKAETDKIRADTDATGLQGLKTVSDMKMAHGQHAMAREQQAHAQGMDQVGFLGDQVQAQHGRSMDQANFGASRQDASHSQGMDQAHFQASEAQAAHTQDMDKKQLAQAAKAKPKASK
jgi:hypothetical protein